MDANQMLTRNLLYTEKNSDEEFGLSKQVLDEFYGLFITTTDTISWTKCPSFLDFFNEVFFQLTLLYDDVTAPEHIDDFLNGEMNIFPPKPRYAHNDHTSEANMARSDYDGEKRSIQKYVYCFVWLILAKMPSHVRHVHFALLAIDKKLRKSGSLMFESFRKFHETHKFVVEIDIKPTPDTSLLWLGGYEEWVKVTKDYDQKTIKQIVGRCRTLQEKQAILKELKRYCAQRWSDTPKHPECSHVTLGDSANEAFLDGLLMEAQTEQVKKEVEAKEIEKSKDDIIKKLTEENEQLILDKNRLESEKNTWKKKYELLVREINERNRKIMEKRIPTEFKILPGSEIIQQLVNEGMIKLVPHRESRIYKWEGSKKLFGYFVERVSDELSLRKSGKSGNIIWEPFMQAFYNAEDLRHEAASAISAMKKKGALMPDDADKIEKAIEYAEGMAAQYKN